MCKAAVLGSPIAHSLSPALHRAAYRYLGLDWDYTAIECTQAEFPTFFAGLDDTWRGLSLTMPLKEVVLEVVDQVSALARIVHSANTVYRTDGLSTWQATNTDVEGMQQALREAGCELVTAVRILGAGATARSAVAAMAGLGAKRVVVHARRREAAQAIAELASELGLRCTVADMNPVAGDEDLLVSTLPSDVAAPWARISVPPHTALLDASYHPWPTPLAAAWQARGTAPVASGRDMLIWQAVAQVRLMTGADFPDEEMAATMRAVL